MERHVSCHESLKGLLLLIALQNSASLVDCRNSLVDDISQSSCRVLACDYGAFMDEIGGFVCNFLLVERKYVAEPMSVKFVQQVK